MASALELGISFEKENERLMQEAAADAADTDAITLSTYGTYRRKPAIMHRSALFWIKVIYVLNAILIYGLFKFSFLWTPKAPHRMASRSSDQNIKIG